MTTLPSTINPAATYTTKEISTLLDIPVPTVHGWVGRGEFTPVGKRGKANIFTGVDVLKMAEYRNTAPKKATKAKAVVPASPVVHAAVLSVVSEPTPSALPEGHAKWFTGTEDGGREAEVVPFGPISLPVVRDNTVVGQGMVPSVDPNYSFDAGEAVVLANALQNAETAWIYGPSGSGKTSGIKQIAGILNWPLFRINMNGDFTVDDFVGTTEVVTDPKTGNAVTKFVAGPLINAMRHGGILLIDEVTATPAHILLVLQAVLERAEDVHGEWAAGRSHTTFVNTANGGEVIHAHPRFRILVTDNTNGQGDITGAFAGTNVMNEAFRSRFTMWLHKGYPTAGAWKKMLVSKTGIDADTAKVIVDVALDVNKGSAQLGATTVTSNIVVNPRDTLAIARLHRTFGDIGIAFKVGSINAMNPGDPDRQFMTDLIKAKLAI